MHSTSNSNNLFSTENLKCVEINGTSTNNNDTRNFMNGIENVRSLLNKLEKSVRKSSKYEEQLIRCKSNHCHIHDINEWWDTDLSDEEYKYSKENVSRNHIGLSESLSTMSIVYLQFQYEELLKQYKALLQAYNERCSAVDVRNGALTKLRQSLKLSNAQIIHAHQTILSVGNKYLNLKRIRNEQKNRCETRISKLKGVVREVIKGLEAVGLEFDTQLTRYLSEESNSEAALLLSQVRKCNQLYLENLRLKACLKKITIMNDN